MLSLCSIGVYIILSNLNDNIVFFYPPSEISKIKKNSKVRVGGIVKKGSITREIDNKIRFIITDYSEELEIIYQGVLPALFREGQGIVAEGTLQPTRSFFAKKLLAKHDENYMPHQMKQHIDRVKHY
jgi:cytochrome c-type biogenesis protein CcmE